MTLCRPTETPPIIWQNASFVRQLTTDEKLLSSSNGCKRIREASEVRNGEVLKKLNEIANNDFVYHMNNEFYKLYTMAPECSEL